MSDKTTEPVKAPEKPEKDRTTPAAAKAASAFKSATGRR